MTKARIKKSYTYKVNDFQVFLIIYCSIKLY